jgi:predicted RNA binding protein YcfA (HicA-like mRNA interferase family)
MHALESVGFEYRSTEGSHAKLRHPDGSVVIGRLHRSPAAPSARSCGRPG